MIGRQVAKRERITTFSLEGYVPQDHLFRAIDRLSALAECRQHLAGFYSHTGRPSIDTELTVRCSSSTTATVPFPAALTCNKVFAAPARIRRGYSVATAFGLAWQADCQPHLFTPQQCAYDSLKRRGQVCYNASTPLSRLRMHTRPSSSATKILPSPGLSVAAAARIAAITLGTRSLATTISLSLHGIIALASTSAGTRAASLGCGRRQ
jgi:hypothetical protein